MSDRPPTEPAAPPGAAPEGPRRRKPDHRRAKTRRAILTGASDLFTRQGIEVTTIDEIAASAGVSVGTVYFHFASKDGVVLALVARVLDTAAEYLAIARQSESPLERVLRAGDVYFRFATEQSVAFRFISERLPQPGDGDGDVDGGEDSPKIATEITQRVGAFVASIAADLAQAMDDGEIDRVPIDEAMAFLWGSWTGVAGLMLRGDSLAISPDLGARALTLGRTVLIRGLGGTLPESLEPSAPARAPAPDE